MIYQIAKSAKRIVVKRIRPRPTAYRGMKHSGPDLAVSERDRKAHRVVGVTLLDCASRLEDVQRLFIEIARDFDAAVPDADTLVLRDCPCERGLIDTGEV